MPMLKSGDIVVARFEGKQKTSSFSGEHKKVHKSQKCHYNNGYI